MAMKKYYIGGMGPYLYDDTDDIDDADGDFAGETRQGFITDGRMSTTHIATEDDDLVRKADIEDAAGGHNPVTLNASATTGGLSLSTQELGHRAATNSQTGYATNAHITAIEANTSDRHNELHTVVSHNDTNATGSELNELTDGSTTSLHDHAGGGDGSVLSYTSISNMRAESSSPDDNTAVLLLGYYTPGDGGGGMFFWDNSSTDTDNDGTIIKATTIATGRFHREYSSVVNVKWFGAKGDASNDDTTEIQAAIDFLSSGGEVFFPVGDYKISSTLDIDTSGITLRGENADRGRSAWAEWPSIIYWAGGTNDVMIQLDSSGTEDLRGIKFRELVINAQTTSNVTPIDIATNTSDGVMEDLVIRNIDNPVTLGIGVTGWHFSRIELFNIEDIGIHLTGKNHRTTFNECEASTTDGTISGSSVIHIGSSSNHCSNVNFYACDFEHKGLDYQINAENVRALNISGGYTESVTASKAFLKLGHSNTPTYAEGVSMTGVYHNGNDAREKAIYIEAAKGLLISGNHFINHTNGVIVDQGVYTVEDVVIFGNYSDDSTFNDENAISGIDKIKPSVDDSGDMAIEFDDNKVELTNETEGDGVEFLSASSGYNASFRPQANDDVRLGTSSARWSEVNAVEFNCLSNYYMTYNSTGVGWLEFVAGGLSTFWVGENGNVWIDSMCSADSYQTRSSYYNGDDAIELLKQIQPEKDDQGVSKLFADEQIAKRRYLSEEKREKLQPLLGEKWKQVDHTSLPEGVESKVFRQFGRHKETGEEIEAHRISKEDSDNYEVFEKEVIEQDITKMIDLMRQSIVLLSNKVNSLEEQLNERNNKNE